MTDPKKRLTLSDVKGMAWREVFKHYFPDMSEKDAEYLLWNMTCYPFDDETTLGHIYDLYLESIKENKV